MADNQNNEQVKYKKKNTKNKEPPQKKFYPMYPKAYAVPNQMIVQPQPMMQMAPQTIGIAQPPTQGAGVQMVAVPVGPPMIVTQPIGPPVMMAQPIPTPQPVVQPIVQKPKKKRPPTIIIKRQYYREEDDCCNIF